ncbi:MAG: SbcC/MukB-like Walker B domain-containing protein, partial [Egibacteraceae bacterium]
AARAAEQEALAAVESAEDALAALPARAALEASARDHAEAQDLQARLAKGAQLLAEAHEAASAARTRLDEARAHRASAQRALEEARWAHRAHDLAGRLVLGENCPVCRQPVSTLPDAAPSETGQADENAAASERIVTKAERELTEATLRRTRYEEQRDALRTQAETLAARLAEGPPATELDPLLAALDAAEPRVAAARAARSQAVGERQSADRQVDALGEREQQARREFDATRDHLAALGPPALDRTSLTEDWQALLAWARTQEPALRAAATAAGERRQRLQAARRELADKLQEACREVGVDADGRTPRDAVADAAYRADAERSRIADAVAEAVRLGTERTRQAERQTVAAQLGQHLSARNFEKWVLDEALLRLTSGATDILHELSGGAYSLSVEPRSSNFAVIDHRNADALRSARTLSGGETFLASLALALALADEVALLASGGAARLDAIFLDEGFGALDPATLDVVASAIEELGARRMVGVVTHVRELAERLPVRFEVRKGPAGATVERVVV